jgi:hypothetical protein
MKCELKMLALAGTLSLASVFGLNAAYMPHAAIDVQPSLPARVRAIGRQEFIDLALRRHKLVGADAAQWYGQTYDEQRLASGQFDENAIGCIIDTYSYRGHNKGERPTGVGGEAEKGFFKGKTVGSLITAHPGYFIVGGIAVLGATGVLLHKYSEKFRTHVSNPLIEKLNKFAENVKKKRSYQLGAAAGVLALASCLYYREYLKNLAAGFYTKRGV